MALLGTVDKDNVPGSQNEGPSFPITGNSLPKSEMEAMSPP